MPSSSLLLLPRTIPIGILDTDGYQTEAHGRDEGAAPRGGTKRIRGARHRVRHARRHRSNGWLHQGRDLPAVSFEGRVSARPVRAVRRRGPVGRRGAPGSMVHPPQPAVRRPRDAGSVAQAALRRRAGGGAGRRHARRAATQGAGASAAAGAPFPAPSTVAAREGLMVYLAWLVILLIPYWLGPLIVWLTRKAGARPVFEPFTAGRGSGFWGFSSSPICFLTGRWKTAACG